jgi:polyisoprenoid-binding protein YceI
MHGKSLRFGWLVSLLILSGIFTPAQAEDYIIDTAHAAVTFKTQHIGISWVYGRFNKFSGDFSFDKAQPEKSKFALVISSASIDTGNEKRDMHLSGPDFLNVRQYPTIRFESKTVKASDKGYEVQGDLTMHGKTQSITLLLTGGNSAEFPKGVQRVGFTTEFVVNRSAFGMTNLVGPVGEEIHLAISFEGIKK